MGIQREGDREVSTAYRNSFPSLINLGSSLTHYLQWFLTPYHLLATVTKSSQHLPRLQGLLIGPLFWNWAGVINERCCL